MLEMMKNDSEKRNLDKKNNTSINLFLIVFGQWFPRMVRDDCEASDC